MSAPGTPPKTSALFTRSAKIAAVAGTAFVAASGGYLATRAFGGIERATAPSALQVRVVPAGDYWAAHPYAPYFVFPASPAPPSAVSRASDENWTAYAARNGGIAGSPQIVRLELRGTTPEPVVIQGLRARVTARRPAARGWFWADPGCGAEDLRIAVLDLDARPPTVKMYGEFGRETPMFALSVTSGDTELVEVHAHTETGDLDWIIEIPYSSARGTGTLVVDDGGKPFRVTTERSSRGFSSLNPLEREPGWDDGIDAC